MTSDYTVSMATRSMRSYYPVKRARTSSYGGYPKRYRFGGGYRKKRYFSDAKRDGVHIKHSNSYICRDFIYTEGTKLLTKTSEAVTQYNTVDRNGVYLGAFTFNLNSVSQGSELAGVYQQYRVKRVEAVTTLFNAEATVCSSSNNIANMNDVGVISYIAPYKAAFPAPTQLINGGNWDVDALKGIDGLSFKVINGASPENKGFVQKPVLVWASDQPNAPTNDQGQFILKHEWCSTAQKQSGSTDPFENGFTGFYIALQPLYCTEGDSANIFVYFKITLEFRRPRVFGNLSSQVALKDERLKHLQEALKEEQDKNAEQGRLLKALKDAKKTRVH